MVLFFVIFFVVGEGGVVVMIGAIILFVGVEWSGVTAALVLAIHI